MTRATSSSADFLTPATSFLRLPSPSSIASAANGSVPPSFTWSFTECATSRHVQPNRANFFITNSFSTSRPVTKISKNRPRLSSTSYASTNSEQRTG